MPSAAYSKDDEEPDVNDPIQMDDLSDQEVSDVMEPASRVPFIIKKASVRKQYADANDKSSEVEVTRLVIDAAIDAAGIDGDGKYANKHLFSELILSFNKETHSSEWWMKRSRGPTKQFYTALGYDPKKLPVVDVDFLSELGGKEFIADIKKKPQQEKTAELNDKGKNIYRDTGDFRNELTNFRAAS